MNVLQIQEQSNQCFPLSRISLAYRVSLNIALNIYLYIYPLSSFTILLLSLSLSFHCYFTRCTKRTHSHPISTRSDINPRIMVTITNSTPHKTTNILGLVLLPLRHVNDIVDYAIAGNRPFPARINNVLLWRNKAISIFTTTTINFMFAINTSKYIDNKYNHLTSILIYRCLYILLVI